MRKLVLSLLLVFSFCVSAVAAPINLEDMTDDELISACASIIQALNARGVNFLYDDLTRKYICDYFENQGIEIYYVMALPLVEKDDGGLYGGKERWFITFADGEQIASWVWNYKITYCYGGVEYDDVPLF